MTYHWEWVSADQIVLFQEGTTWSGSLPALGATVGVNKMGPYWGEEAVWRASGGFIDQVQDFPDAESAMRAVEAIVTANGDTIEGR
jgi:hypothetical protein